VRARKHFDGLREAENARKERDAVAFEVVGLACAIPVLVERANRLRCVVGEAKHARDVCAALASRDDHFARAFRSARQHAEQLPHPSQPEVSGGHVSRDESKRLERLRPVGHLEVGLDAVIVGAEERGKSGGVARAPEVFHQKRVEERRAHLLRQAQHLGEAHADQTRTDSVPGPLPFGQVEGMRQPGQYV